MTQRGRYHKHGMFRDSGVVNNETARGSLKCANPDCDLGLIENGQIVIRDENDKPNHLICGKRLGIPEAIRIDQELTEQDAEMELTAV